MNGGKEYIFKKPYDFMKDDWVCLYISLLTYTDLS